MVALLNLPQTAGLSRIFPLNLLSLSPSLGVRHAASDGPPALSDFLSIYFTKAFPLLQSLQFNPILPSASQRTCTNNGPKPPPEISIPRILAGQKTGHVSRRPVWLDPHKGGPSRIGWYCFMIWP